MFYYRHKQETTAFLITKTPLNEEELANYDEITEQEYNDYQAQLVGAASQHAMINSNNKRAKIAHYKTLLRESDYKQAKWLDGDLSDEDYAPIKEARHNWRAEINRLEEELEND